MFRWNVTSAWSVAVAYDTDDLLLKSARAGAWSATRQRAGGWGLCPEHQELSDDGFVALVECDPQRSGSPSGAARMMPE